ncbi:hypothetical protein H5410_050747 [Solanum commersonii]|uniref:Uncharacterized protein n=1 Tax=Solanum commersonii TaxID=4109 RepID=A0A9J5WYV7_SOLCO|nr:hypothetical protein H5410_050747 [Solanum commersonii]
MLGDLPKGRTPPFVLVRKALKEKDKKSDEMISRRFSDNFREAEVYLPMIKNAQLLKAKHKQRSRRRANRRVIRRSRLTLPSDPPTLFSEVYKY